MKNLSFVLLAMAVTLCFNARAERLAEGGGGNAPLQAPSVAPNPAVETPFERERELPITFVTEDNSELRGGNCVISVKRQSGNSIFIELKAKSLEEIAKRSEEIGAVQRGVMIPADKYPMRVTEFAGTSPEKIETKISYDGSVFKIIDIDRYEAPAQITVYELQIDSNLSTPRAMRVLRFEGDNLSTAKPIDSRLVCDENLS